LDRGAEHLSAIALLSPQRSKARDQRTGDGSDDHKRQGTTLPQPKPPASRNRQETKLKQAIHQPLKAATSLQYESPFYWMVVDKAYACSQFKTGGASLETTVGIGSGWFGKARVHSNVACCGRDETC
jgi:hypothetical protein